MFDWPKAHVDGVPEFITVNTIQDHLEKSTSSNSTALLDHYTSSCNISGDTDSQTRYRTHIDIYNTCNLVLSVSDPTSYEDTVKHDG